MRSAVLSARRATRHRGHQVQRTDRASKIMMGRMIKTGTPIKHNKWERIFTLLYCLLLPCARGRWPSPPPWRTGPAPTTKPRQDCVKFICASPAVSTGHSRPLPLENRTAELDYDHYLTRQLQPVADAILVFVDDDFSALVGGQMGFF